MLRGNTGVTTSLLLHAAVAFGLSRVAWKVAEPEPQSPPPVVWFGAWGLDARAGAQRGSDDADSEAGEPLPDGFEATAPLEPAMPAAERAAAPEPAQPTSRRDERPAAPTVDWADVRRRAIDDVVAESERAASYRSFAFTGRIGEQQERFAAAGQRQVAAAGDEATGRAVFDLRSRRRAGLDEASPFGEYIVWVNDDCYQTHGTRNVFILPSTLRLYDVPMTNCVKTEPRDDLFAEQKPSYLMSAEELEERAEQWRHTETGAVAEFGEL